MLRFVVKASVLKDEAVDKAGKLINSEAGAAAIEYCLIAGLIALMIVSGLGLLGNSLGSKFQTVASSLG